MASPSVSDNLQEEVLRLRKANETLLHEVEVRQRCCLSLQKNPVLKLATKTSSLQPAYYNT